MADIRLVGRTGSTNADLKALAREGAAHGLTLVADVQEAGRGRLGRVWESPPGNLYLSTLLRIDLPPERRPLVALAAAVAVAEACGPEVMVKWPNDVLAVDGRKIAGILAEAEDDWIVVGVGVNLTNAPEGVDAVSLSELGTAIDRDTLARAIVDGLQRWTTAPPDGLLNAWRSLAVLGRRVRIAGIEGVLEDIDADGAALIRTRSRLRRVLAGDVEMIG